MYSLTETEDADHTYHATHSQYTDTDPTSPKTDPISQTPDRVVSRVHECTPASIGACVSCDSSTNIKSCVSVYQPGVKGHNSLNVISVVQQPARVTVHTLPLCSAGPVFHSEHCHCVQLGLCVTVNIASVFSWACVSQ